MSLLNAKKNSFNSRITKMRLSFMVLDGALGLHRNKKHKRMKHKNKNGMKKHCDGMRIMSCLILGHLHLSYSLSSPMHYEKKRKKSNVGSNEKVYTTVADVRVVNNGNVLAKA